MKGKITADRLRKALDTAMGVLSTTGRDDNRIVRLAMKADDTITVTSCLPFIGSVSTIPGSVEVPGETSIVAEPISEALHIIPKDAEIDIEKNGNRLVFSIEKMNLTMSLTCPAYPIETPPAIPGSSVVVDAKAMKELIEDCLVIAPKNNVRAALNGVRIEAENGKLTGVATDGRIMIFRDVDATGGDLPKATIPANMEKALKALSSSDTLTYSTDGKWVWVKDGDTVINALAAENKFPAWRNVVPRNYTDSISPKSEKMQKAVKLAMDTTEAKRKGNSKILLDISNEKGITISGSAEEGSSKATAEGAVNGPDIQIYFQGTLLLSVLKILGKETVKIEYSSATMPAVFHDEIGTTVVLMPMQKSSGTR